MKPDQNEVSENPLTNPDALRLKAGYRWFSAPRKQSPDGWYGPHNSAEAAALDCRLSEGSEPIFVTQGDRYGDNDWEVETKLAFEIILPRL